MDRGKLLTLLLLLPQLALSQAYRWTDESGKVHFSDKPPPDSRIPSEEIQVEGPSPIGQGPEVRAIRERTTRLLEAEAEAREKARQEQAKKEAERAVLERKCRRAEHEVRVLSGPVKYVNEQGERYDVSEERVRRDREKIQKWIEENCS